METRDAIRARRTVRRFAAEPLPEGVLTELLDLARLAPSAANRQPLEYLVVDEESGRDTLFGHVTWGAYVKPRRIPSPEQRPPAYVVVLWNRDRSGFPQWEAGAAIQNLLLGAVDLGLATCWMGGIDRDGIKAAFGVPEACDVVGVIAVGRPAESPVLEERDDEVKYWLDEDDVLHVPKRGVGAILHRRRY